MSFRSALSGLNAASAELRVIGNNVANASTTGFKKSRAEFADVYAVSNLGVSANAIGSGVRLSNVAQQFTQGNIDFTDNNLDLAVNGRGFFVVDDNGTNAYTRAGGFRVDRDGKVVNAQGQQLQVFQADGSGNITGALGNLALDTSDISPSATGNLQLTLNLNANAPDMSATTFDPDDSNSYNNSTSLSVYDSLGNPLLASTYYRRVGANNWQVYTYVTEPDGTRDYVQPSGLAANAPATMSFDSTGNLTGVSPAVAGSPNAIQYDPLSLATGAANMQLVGDYSSTTQYGSAFSVNALTQDGFTSGRLSGVDIGDSGVVSARYTNGQSRTLGQVALADFPNAQGLRPLGDTGWAETYDSGSALIGAPGSSSLGLLQSGGLESSNVDLTEQLVSMITAQRNFQANAQVISTADTVTQTVINIR